MHIQPNQCIHISHLHNSSAVAEMAVGVAQWEFSIGALQLHYSIALCSNSDITPKDFWMKRFSRAVKML